MIKAFLRMALAGSCLSVSACQGSTSSVSLAGYNHMEAVPIQFFTVNGTMGPNIRPGAGGKESCCVMLPTAWRPGLKVKVGWEYDRYEGDTRARLPAQSIEVEVPKYARPQRMQLHFYDRHRVRIVLSECSPEHPFYPMATADLLPWVPFTSKAAMMAAAQRGGGSIEC